MRISFVFALLLVGCVFHEDDPISLGDVKVTASGSDRVAASACLDAGFLDCKNSVSNLELRHDNVTTPMPYTGFLFAEHQAGAPLGDPTSLFDITDGVAHANIFLPPPFTLAGGPTGHLDRGETFQLTWEPGTSAMRWDFDYSCDGGGGGAATGGSARDRDGALTIDTTQIVDTIADGHLTGECTVTLQVARVLHGTIEGNLHTKLAAGVQRRSVMFTITSPNPPE